MVETPQLLLQREIRATIGAVFEAWTQAEVLAAWWGPDGVTCVGAEVDLRVGGAYRIGNLVPSGETVWISGEYLEIDPPHRLVFSWRMEGSAEQSQVTVGLSERANGTTRVVVVHEHIASPEVAAEHERGWNGCLDGLVRHFQ